MQQEDISLETDLDVILFASFYTLVSLSLNNVVVNRRQSLGVTRNVHSGLKQTGKRALPSCPSHLLKSQTLRQMNIS